MLVCTRLDSGPWVTGDAGYCGVRRRPPLCLDAVSLVLWWCCDALGSCGFVLVLSFPCLSTSVCWEFEFYTMPVAALALYILFNFFSHSFVLAYRWVYHCIRIYICLSIYDMICSHILIHASLLYIPS